MSSEGSGWVAITTPSGANTKGSWIEIIASTGFASKWILLQMVGATNPNEKALFEIGTGSAGNEVAVVDDQQFHPRNQSGGSGRGTTYSFPLVLAAGTRISIRAEHEGGISRTYDVTVTISDFVPSGSVPSAIQSSGHKQIVTAIAADGYGPWVELVSALDNTIGWASLSLYSFASTFEAEFDIGIGAAGSEVVAYEKVGFEHFGGGGNSCSMGACFPITIASGTRVAIRVKDPHSSSNNYEIGALFG